MLRDLSDLDLSLSGDTSEKIVDPPFEVLLGQVWRSAGESQRMVAERKGIRPSFHELGLAGHLELFRDGEYVTDTEAHRCLGKWWEAQHPLCRWGGRLGDGNHYSIAHGGLA